MEAIEAYAREYPLKVSSAFFLRTIFVLFGVAMI